MNMHEMGRPGDPKPTPQELNGSLCSIYQMLPITDFDMSSVKDATNMGSFVVKSFEAVRQRRKESEYKTRLLNTASELLSQSSLSPTGRVRLLDEIGSVYERGIHGKENSNAYDKAYLILQVNDLDCGGVFDRQLAPSLECEWYRYTSWSIRNWKTILHERLEYAFGDLLQKLSDTQKQSVLQLVQQALTEMTTIVTDEEAEQDRLNQETKLGTWREDIIKTHGVDPEISTSTPQAKD